MHSFQHKIPLPTSNVHTLKRNFVVSFLLTQIGCFFYAIFIQLEQVYELQSFLFHICKPAIACIHANPQYSFVSILSFALDE